MDASSLITVASIIAGFGVTVLTFRLQRELSVAEENRKTDWGKITWIPPADYLVILAIVAALLFAVLPLLMSPVPDRSSLRLAATASTLATILLAGYVPAILAHYRFIYWLHKPRGPFLFWELLFVATTLVASVFFCRAVWNNYE